MADPVQVKELNPEDNAIMLHYNRETIRDGFCYYGDGGYVLPKNYMEHADPIRNMQLRSDDTWVVTFARTGTTMTQELVWLLKNDFNYEEALKLSLGKRWLFLESFILFVDYLDELKKINDATADALEDYADFNYKKAEDVSSPRFFKSHLPFSLLPVNLLSKSKVIYVARDPRDVCVSLYHHNKLFKCFFGDLKSYWNIFKKDLVIWCPIFSHMKEAWSQRNHPNMLFLFYEDMRKDLPSAIRRISTFLEKECTGDQIEKLCKYLDINNFRKNNSVHPTWMTNSKIVDSDSQPFIRKGKIGEWRECFDPEMAEEAERWMRDNLADTDLRFPTFDI